jgi:hypothetical protein
MRKSLELQGVSIPFVQAAHVGLRQRPSAILLRTSWTTDYHGAANGIAQAWHNPRNEFNNCHYVVDEERSIRCIPDNVGSRGGIKRTISINVCYDPPSAPRLMTVEHAARLTARLCKLHRIPPRLLSPSDVEDWLKRKWKRNGGVILETAGDFPLQHFFYSLDEEYSTL